jgi:hypothetical protein
MFLPMTVSELCVKMSYIGSKIINVAAISAHTKCVEVTKSQMLATCCKVHWKSFNVIKPSLSMLDINYVQVAALSGNVLCCNWVSSKIRDHIIFIRLIGGSVWFRCMCHSCRPDLTPSDFCLWGWMNSEVDRWINGMNCLITFWMLLKALRNAKISSDKQLMFFAHESQSALRLTTFSNINCEV